MTKGFQRKQIKKFRNFLIERKIRFPRDNSELSVDWITLSVPRLHDSNAEIGWAMLWISEQLYSPEWTAKSINQAFLLTADGRETLGRLEKNPFDDEPSAMLLGEKSEAITKILNRKLKEVL